MIIIIGYLDVKPSDVDEYLTDVSALTTIARTEKGCLFYTVTSEDAAAGRLLIVERWRDQASLTAHLEAPHTAEFVSKWMNRMTNDLRKYDASNERSLMD